MDVGREYGDRVDAAEQSASSCVVPRGRPHGTVRILLSEVPSSLDLFNEHFVRRSDAWSGIGHSCDRMEEAIVSN